MNFRYLFGLLFLSIACTPLTLHAEGLHDAAYDGKLAEVKTLVSQGADVNQKNADGAYPLNYAAAGNQLEVLHYLIAQGANVSAQDDVGDTALHCATRYGGGQVETVSLLLNAGINMDLKNSEEKTALDYALEEKQDALNLLQ